MSLLPDREFRPLLNEVHRGLPAQCGKDTGMKPLCAAPPKASFTLFSSEIPYPRRKMQVLWPLLFSALLLHVGVTGKMGAGL